MWGKPRWPLGNLILRSSLLAKYSLTEAAFFRLWRIYEVSSNDAIDAESGWLALLELVYSVPTSSRLFEQNERTRNRIETQGGISNALPCPGLVPSPKRARWEKVIIVSISLQVKVNVDAFVDDRHDQDREANRKVLNVERQKESSWRQAWRSWPSAFGPPLSASLNSISGGEVRAFRLGAFKFLRTFRSLSQCWLFYSSWKFFRPDEWAILNPPFQRIGPNRIRFSAKNRMWIASPFVFKTMRQKWPRAASTCWECICYRWFSFGNCWSYSV